MGYEIKIELDELRKRKLFLATPCYGGMMAGMCARSVADLSALCVQHGVQLMIYFLFNESLITRARNYCCLPGSSKVLTENGMMTMKEIVDTKYKGLVQSLDENNEFVWREIVNHWSKPNTEGKVWVSLQTSKLRKKLICTDDHKVAVFDDCFDPKIKYVPAKETQGKYSVRILRDKKNHKENALLNKEQLDILCGTVLGDAHITPTGAVQINHGEYQGDYAKHKGEIFGVNTTEFVDKAKVGKKGFIRNKYIGYRTNLPTNCQTKKLRELVYVDGKKQIGNLLNYLTPLGLAYWYMDDGAYKNGVANGAKPTSMLCTHNFDYDSHLVIKDWFKNKFNIEANIKPTKNNQYFIDFNHENSRKFWNLIAKYVVPTMQYKLPEEYKFGVSIQKINNKKLDFSGALIERVVPINDKRVKNSDLYDIEVKGTHNFVANRTVVHNCDEFVRSDATHLMFIDSDIGFNPHDVLAMLAMQSEDSKFDVLAGPYPKKCISWEKIKHAVDRGFADQNPNNLENFVGDYVFNPKMGMAQIPINEPVEVSEAGTGFMMIKKSTLTRYKEAYPYLSYRPDHVRTEAFDGSREIHAYFDCTIDRGYDIGDLQNIIRDYNADKLTSEEFKTQSTALLEREKTASKRYLSEDYNFCYYVQKMGGQVWFCPWMRLQHVGTYIFGGSLADLAAIGAPATADAVALKKQAEAAKKAAEIQADADKRIAQVLPPLPNKPGPKLLPGLGGAPLK